MCSTIVLQGLLQAVLSVRCSVSCRMCCRVRCRVMLCDTVVVAGAVQSDAV